MGLFVSKRGYSGEYHDAETGTIYLRARNYDPSIGRFTQQDGWRYGDPSDPLSLNLYTYCANNPIIFFDNSGNNYIIEKEDGDGNTYYEAVKDKWYMDVIGFIFSSSSLSGLFNVVGGTSYTDDSEGVYKEQVFNDLFNQCQESSTPYSQYFKMAGLAIDFIGKVSDYKSYIDSVNIANEDDVMFAIWALTGMSTKSYSLKSLENQITKTQAYIAGNSSYFLSPLIEGYWNNKSAFQIDTVINSDLDKLNYYIINGGLLAKKSFNVNPQDITDYFNYFSNRLNTIKDEFAKLFLKFGGGR